MARKMKDSGIEWIGALPTDFTLYKLKYLLSSPLCYGANESGTLYSDILPRYIRITDISPNGTLKNSGMLSLDESSAQNYMLHEGDILFARSGATVGKSFIYHNYYGRAAYAGYLIKASFNRLVLPEFVYYYTCSSAYEIWKNSIFIQSTIQNIGADRYSNLPISIPNSIDKQLRIVHYLNDFCSKFDAIIYNLQTSIEEYKKLKQAVITQAVTKGVRGEREMKDSGVEWIGTYPSNWKIIKIKWLLHERKDRSVTGLEEPLSMSQKKGLIPTKEMDSIPNMASSFIGAKLVYKGDLVFNKLKAHLGVFSVSKYNGLVSPDYAVYYRTGLANLNFLELLFKTPQYINEFKKKSSGVGAGLTRLYTGDLYSIYCALPPLVEQEEIADYLDIKCAEIDKLIAKKEQLVKELESYKKSLIYEVVTGKREV